MNKIERKIGFLLEFNTDIIDSNGEEVFETKLNINQAIKDIALYIEDYMTSAYRAGYVKGFADKSAEKPLELYGPEEIYFKFISE